MSISVSIGQVTSNFIVVSCMIIVYIPNVTLLNILSTVI